MTVLGELAALTTAILWAISSFIFTSAVLKTNYIQINILRLFFAFVYLLITIFVCRFGLNVSMNQLIFLSLSGLFGLVIGDSFLFNAFKLIGPRISLVMMTLSPAFTTIIAYFALNERISLFQISGIIITIIGIIVVLYDKEGADNSKFKITSKGIIFAAIAALGQGIGLILVKKAFNYGDIDGIVATFYRILAALIIFAPYIIKKKLISASFESFRNDLRYFGKILLGSVLGPYLGITLSILAVEFTQTGIAATLMATVPIVMLPMTRIIYKEKFTWKSVLGAFIAVAGVACLILN